MDREGGVGITCFGLLTPRPMKFPCFLAIASLLPLLAACSKFDTKKSTDKQDATAATPPRRNAAESLGFASETTEGYTQPDARPASSASPAPAVAPAAPTTPVPAAKPAIRRTLTATDGRTLEAELLAKNDEAVKIRRLPDTREFTIPLDRISEADRAFVRESELPALAAR